MIKFKTSEGARISYMRDEDNQVRVEIEGYWFSRKGWDELTTELFLPPPSYILDPDVWLPQPPFKWGTTADRWPPCPHDPKEPPLLGCLRVYEEKYGS